MAGLFGNLGEDPRMMRQALKSRYSAARLNLLLMIIFTTVNIITLVVNAGGYFLFSAAIPYLLVFVGMLLCGKFPMEMYSEKIDPNMFQDHSLFVGALIIAILVLIIYLLLWFFSRKGKVAFMIAALIFFAVDTVVLLIFGGLMANFFMDLLFHIWLIVILVMGINAHKKLATLPKEDLPIEAEFEDITDEYNSEEISDEGEFIDDESQSDENSGEALLTEPDENE